MIECIISFILPMLYLPDAKLGKVCRSLNSEIWAFVTARQQTQRRDQPRNEGRRSEIRMKRVYPNAQILQSLRHVLIPSNSGMQSAKFQKNLCKGYVAIAFRYLPRSLALLYCLI
jgi:hypothetical protein